MNVRLGELKIDQLGNLSLTAAGASEPYFSVKIEPDNEAWKLFKIYEEKMFLLLKAQLKIK